MATVLPVLVEIESIRNKAINRIRVVFVFLNQYKDLGLHKW